MSDPIHFPLNKGAFHGVRACAPMGLRYDIYPSKTQDEFIMSGALENCIMGPRGEGKTESGIMAMVVHASRQDKKLRPIPWAIVRDTWANLERTTLASFKYPREGSFAHTIRDRLIFRDGGRQIILPGMWEAWLFGCDTAKDLDKLQSMQLGGLWLEEAAPALTEDIGYGVAEATWLMGITSLRYPLTTNARAQITMNYPDENHWTWLRFFENGSADRRLFRIQKGENVHISQKYRDNMAMALQNNPELTARLVEGRPAQVCQGVAVTPDYKENVHRAPVELLPISHVEVIRFWDGGLHPACVFGQFTPGGKFRCLDTVQGNNIGMKQLIETLVKPLMFRKYSSVNRWRDTGDPSLNTPDNSDSDERPADKIESMLGTIFEPGESSWTARVDVMRDVLTKMVDGEPMFELSRTDRVMHRILNGGWHYRKDNTGRVFNDRAVKDENSHPGDALSHGLAMVFKFKSSDKPRQRTAEMEFNPLTYNHGCDYLDRQDSAENDYQVF